MVGSLDQLLNFAPVSREKAISLGMQHFLRDQEPEDVEFVAHPNGYSLQIKTDEENVQKAKEFWEKNIEDNL